LLFFPVRVTGCHRCMAARAEFNEGKVESPPQYLEEAVLFTLNLTVWSSVHRHAVSQYVPVCSSMSLFWQKMWVILWYFMPYVCICVVVTVSFILCHVVSAVSCGVLFSCTLMLLESFAVVSRSCCSRLLGVSGVSGVNSCNSCCHSVFLALQHYNAMQWTLLDISYPDVMAILCWMVW